MSRTIFCHHAPPAPPHPARPSAAVNIFALRHIRTILGKSCTALSLTPLQAKTNDQKFYLALTPFLVTTVSALVLSLSRESFPHLLSSCPESTSNALSPGNFVIRILVVDFAFDSYLLDSPLFVSVQGALARAAARRVFRLELEMG